MTCVSMKAAPSVPGSPRKNTAGSEQGELLIGVGLAGPSLRFHMDAVAALTGADFEAEIDGSFVPLWTSVLVRAGSVLTVGKVNDIYIAAPTTSMLRFNVSAVPVA